MFCERNREGADLAGRQHGPFVDGSFFGPEMTLLSIQRRMRVIQIPVNYSKRTGHSAVTGNKLVAFALGLRMIRLILSMRIRGPAGR
jgi:hypothetical protein